MASLMLRRRDPVGNRRAHTDSLTVGDVRLDALRQGSARIDPSRVSVLLWLVWTAGLTLLFGRVAAYNLGNYRPATNDEVELMSVGYKLATRGVMGSDLFAGFSGADAHYFMTLPAQHVLEAASFWMFGVGVAQARWVSLVAGLAIIWIVGWLAYRWYGLGTAVICELLLVVWPSNLTLAAGGLPLLGVARAARYDVLAVAFAWLAIALLDATLRRPRRGTACWLGVCCGIATLTTFTGAFVVPLVAVEWIRERRRHALTDRAIYWVVAGAAVVLVPWMLYSLRYWPDVLGQLTVYGTRWDLTRPTFYLANVLREPLRFHDLLQASTGDPDGPHSRASVWLLVIGVWPAAAYVAWRSRLSGASGDRMVRSSLVTFAALLVLVDQTKTPLYAIILLPSLCLALAALWTGLLGWAWRRGRRRGWQPAVSGALSLALLVLVAVEGIRAYQHSLLLAAQAGQYLGVGLRIEDGLAPGAPVLGPERWWWALHTHPYLSLRGQWFQWTAAAASGDSPRFVDLVSRSRAQSIVVNDNVRGDIRDFPEPLQQQFWAFLDSCTTQVADLDDPTYLLIEVYTINRPSARPDSCA